MYSNIYLINDIIFGDFVGSEVGGHVNERRKVA